MIKLAIKGLFVLLVTNLTLLLTSQSSSAQVNMQLLVQVAKSCQEDVVSPEYYNKIHFDLNSSELVERVIKDDYNGYLSLCIRSRYHYALIVSKLPWLSSAKEIVPGYPSSVAVAALTNELTKSYRRPGYILDCIASQNASSQECMAANFYGLAFDYKVREINFFRSTSGSYLIYVCPSCTVAHDDIDSKDKMITAFVQWFLTLDQTHRREIMSILGDEDNQFYNREQINSEAEKSVHEYQIVRQRVEQQEQEQRRQEILGN